MDNILSNYTLFNDITKRVNTNNSNYNNEQNKDDFKHSNLFFVRKSSSAQTQRSRSFSTQNIVSKCKTISNFKNIELQTRCYNQREIDRFLKSRML